MNKKSLYLIFLILALLTLLKNDVSSKDNKTTIWDGFFKSVTYSRPFISEIHSYSVKTDLGYSQVLNEYNMSVDYLLDKNRTFKLFVETHIGVDIPLYATEFYDNKNTPDWLISSSIPMSMHVFEDMFDNVTAPVINTDYRFGSPAIKAIKYLNKEETNSYIDNISLTWLPIHHECTHLGDEITIFRKDNLFPITRINVSYEYTQLQITLNDPEAKRENVHSLKFGGLLRISDRGLGWYSIRAEEGYTIESLELKESENRFEYWVQYNMQRTEGFLASSRVMNVFSIEVRNRVKYGIPTFKWLPDTNTWETKFQDESRQWSVNAYLGYKFYPKSEEDSYGIGLYLHGYIGINPYGQLRNLNGYKYLGISLTYEP